MSDGARFAACEATGSLKAKAREQRAVSARSEEAMSDGARFAACEASGSPKAKAREQLGTEGGRLISRSEMRGRSPT